MSYLGAAVTEIQVYLVADVVMGYLDGSVHFVVAAVAAAVVHLLTPVAAVVRMCLVAGFQGARVPDKQYSAALLSLIPDPQTH